MPDKLTTIGSRSSDNVNIASVSGVGPYTVTLASSPPSTTVIGDTLSDEAATPSIYLITGISGSNLTVEDLLGAGAAPSAAGASQAFTSRTYSTSQTWENDWDDGDLYDAGDTALGKMYDDGDFVSGATFDGGTVIGLAARVLEPAAGQSHSGAENTGVRILRTGAGTVFLVTVSNMTIRGIEIDVNGNAANVGIDVSGGPTNVTVHRNMVHGCSRGGNSTGIKQSGGSTTGRYLNNLVYDWETTNSSAETFGIQIAASGATTYVCNNTVVDIRADGAAGKANGIWLRNSADIKARNNIAMGTTGTTSPDFNFDFSTLQDSDYNMSSDDTADDGGGANNLINKVTADQFVSLATPNYHLKAGSDAEGAGEDQGQTPSASVAIDIDGFNRHTDTSRDPWDIGCHEYVLVAPGQVHMLAPYGVRPNPVDPVNYRIRFGDA